MRILHLFANYKWTGPADPAIRCAVNSRRAGADALFAIAEWTLPKAEHRVAIELRRARMPVVAGLELRKHFHVVSHLRDAAALRARLDRGDFDVLHAHLLADHLIAAMAMRRATRAPLLVRTLYEPQAPRRSWRERVAFRYTDGVIAPTESCAAQARARFSLAPERVLVQDPPVEPVPERNDGDLRAELGLEPSHFVVGITARIQPHRRFDLLWETFRRLADLRPRSRLVLLGRGNARDTERLVREPVRRLGIADKVVLPGYLYEPQYGRALRSLDALVFLVPGSDGTCRAVREAMAVGLPVVATRRGILAELCGPAAPGGPDCGLACDEDADALAQALVTLHDEPERRAALGGAAQRRARTAMDPARAAERLLAFYTALREAPRERP